MSTPVERYRISKTEDEHCRRCHGTKIISTPYIDSIVYCLYECWECKEDEQDVSCEDEQQNETET